MCLMPYANNKGADQPAHPCSLISTFVVRCLDSIMPVVFTRLYESTGRAIAVTTASALASASASALLKMLVFG